VIPFLYSEKNDGQKKAGNIAENLQDGESFSAVSSKNDL
jgi:hypothetical protein